ncbi:MAG: hypothetical protein HETSPECPRED_010240 [Heterodermia speciosa]|uniref:Uncharacterized protein n=1 Tax=Heterodermia speciosa TaxID=116794 RepID=A0A8H3IAA8_9LECA|nr:MAG: hypothetical protein HETSPECPRED_010240 [Heterodermia speciosa]
MNIHQVANLLHREPGRLAIDPRPPAVLALARPQLHPDAVLDRVLGFFAVGGVLPVRAVEDAARPQGLQVAQHLDADPEGEFQPAEAVAE